MDLCPSLKSYLGTGAYTAGIAQATRLLQLDPLPEEALRQLMTLLVRAGQRSAALVQYETCRRLLADELGVEPTRETIALYEEIRVGEFAASRVTGTLSFDAGVKKRAKQSRKTRTRGCGLSRKQTPPISSDVKP